MCFFLFFYFPPLSHVTIDRFFSFSNVLLFDLNVDLFISFFLKMSIRHIFHPIGENVTVMSHLIIDYVEPLSFSFVFSLCIGFLYDLS
jgi:hypothetical protein